MIYNEGYYVDNMKEEDNLTQGKYSNQELIHLSELLRNLSCTVKNRFYASMINAVAELLLQPLHPKPKETVAEIGAYVDELLDSIGEDLCQRK